MQNNKAILAGPFIGELQWEFFNFVPHIIYLRKQFPRKKIIVLTRAERFDLYGQHVDILVPLRLEKDNPRFENSFKMDNYKDHEYYTIAKYFKIKFKRKFVIDQHIYPDIRHWCYKVKWQFPRETMDFDFLPREANKDYAVEYMYNKKYLTDMILDQIKPNKHTTKMGIIIECLKLSKCFIGDIRISLNAQLALLLRKPLIYTGRSIKEDYIKLLNPLNTPVYPSNDIPNGVKLFYENSI